MSQSLVQVYLHIVFSTKHRRPFLTDSEFRGRVHAYLAGISKKLDSPAIQIGGVADHVHLLCRLSKTVEIAGLVREMKKGSSAWIHVEEPGLRDFQWQAGYGAFSVSPSHVEPLTKYIVGQEEHHKTETFQEEFRRLCRIYEVPIDERYVWD